MPRHAVLLLIGLAVTATAPLRGADQPEVQALLKQEIVGNVLPMSEVQTYCEVRVPEMPNVDTAARWQAEAERLRAAVLERIVYRGQATEWRDAPTEVQWLDTIEGGPGYRIKKLRYEALPGMWIPALLYEPDDLSGKVPAVMNVNGHVGSPGKAYVPKQVRCINQAKRGILALNVEWIGMGQLGTPGFTHYRMNQLDLCGTSGLALFYLAMKRGLDVLLSLEHTDPDRLAVTGLSGGGWQTIFISSLDTRVKLADPVAGYSSFRTRARHLSDLGDSEQTPNDLATVADYTHLTAMMAPRPTLLTKNAKDNCCFASGHSLQPLMDAASPVFQLFGEKDRLRSHVNHDPGTHNYERDNRQAFYRMLGDFFYKPEDGFDPTEIPCDDEVKSKEDLLVELPDEMQDFNTLALRLSEDLPREAAVPEEEKEAAAWRESRRRKLREIVKAKDYQVNAVKFGQQEKSGTKATFWKLQMGGAWTVPAVELVKGTPQKTAILVADGGRGSAAAEAVRLLDDGYRVVAVDPFYFGESRIAQRDFLFALLVAAVGDRPLGLQASQVAAVARWSRQQHGSPITVVALGPRSSLFSLVAAGLEEKAIGRLELHDSLKSLKEVIQQNWAVNQKPELFCFGLLEEFDVQQLTALASPRPVICIPPN